MTLDSEEYVICPICNKKFKILNNAHLSTHNITEKEFDKKYSVDRLSKKSREKRIINSGGDPKNRKKWYKLRKCDVENLILDIDYVICPICGKFFREINKDHLKLHNLTIKEYEKLYPNNRISQKTRKQKDTLTSRMTEELSNKLKKSHTLEGYIEKYGKEEGLIKYNQRSENMRYAKTLDYCIEKYGEEGKKFFEENNRKKGLIFIKENFIEKYGEERYNYWRYTSKTYEGYVKKYGKEEGLKRWMVKNKNISKSHCIIPLDLYEEYQQYKKMVSHYTNISITHFGLKNIEKRGRKQYYDLDHKVSQSYGFLNKIDPMIIGSIYNLEIITRFDNNKKHEKCSMNPKKLIKLVEIDDFYQSMKNEIL